MTTLVESIPEGELLATLKWESRRFTVGKITYTVIDGGLPPLYVGTAIKRDAGIGRNRCALLFGGDENKITITDESGIGISIRRID